MTCTKAPKIQAIFRIFSPISGIFRGCVPLKSLSVFRKHYCKTLSTKTRIVTLSKIFLTSKSKSIAKHCPLKQGL